MAFIIILEYNTVYYKFLINTSYKVIIRIK